MQTKTQSYDIAESKQYKQIKFLRELLEDDHEFKYKLGQEFNEKNEESEQLDNAINN